jgi:hypothetical protein
MKKENSWELFWFNLKEVIFFLTLVSIVSALAFLTFMVAVSDAKQTF